MNLLNSSLNQLWKCFISQGVSFPSMHSMFGRWSPKFERSKLISFSYSGKIHERKREMFYLTTHSTHFIYGYMASDTWLRTILIVRKETRCRHIGYSYRLTARVLLYAPSDTSYTSRGALAGTRNCSMGPPHEGSIRRPIAQ